MSARGKGRPAGKRSNGEGSIYWDESKQRYVGAITVGLDGAGKPIRRKVLGKTRKEVADRLKELSRQAGVLDLTDDEPTVADIAEKFLVAYRRGESQVSTLKAREPRIRRHIIDDGNIARIKVRRLTADHVDGWLNAKVDDGYRLARTGEQRHYSRAMLASIRGDLVQVLNYAVARRMLEHNAAEHTKLPKPNKVSAPKRTLPPEAAARLMHIASVSGRPFATYVLVCISFGARPGEVAALRWSDIDFTAGTINLISAVKRDDNGSAISIGTPKTKERLVRANDTVLAALKRERKVQAEHRLAAGPRWSTDPRWRDLVFTTRLGTPPNKSHLLRSFRSIMAGDELLAQFADFDLYELRHTAASLLIDSGLDRTLVADLLGDNPITVEKHYRHRVQPVIDVTDGWAKVRRHAR